MVQLLITSAICCPLWSSVYECQRVECAFTFQVRTECSMFVMCITHIVCLMYLVNIDKYGSRPFIAYFPSFSNTGIHLNWYYLEM